MGQEEELAAVEPRESVVPSYPWLEYAILVAAGVGGYELKMPFGMLLHRIMGLPTNTVHSLSSLANNQAFQIVGIAILASFIHRRAGLPAAPWLERTLYRLRGDQRIRIWVPGLLGALAVLCLGGLAFAVASLFGVTAPLGAKLNFSSLPSAVALRLTLLYPAASLGAALSEELLYRFGILSILAWLAWTVIPRRYGYRTVGLWIAIVLQALLFGWAHVHEGMLGLRVGGLALQLLIAPQTWAGIVFGYLYAVYGLEAAMVAHAASDLVGFLPFILEAMQHAHH